MNRTTRTGRPLCVITDPSTGLTCHFNPVLFDVLYKVAIASQTCAVELHCVQGNIGNTHIRIDGERWVQQERRRQHPISGEVLQLENVRVS